MHLSFGNHLLRFLKTSFLLFMFLFVFLRAGPFAFVLLSVAVVCSRSLPFALACLLPCALALVCIVCWWAVRSQSYLWVFHAMSQVLIVNKQMAHSHIVVVIAFH